MSNEGWKIGGNCPACGSPIFLRGIGDDLPEIRRACECKPIGQPVSPTWPTTGGPTEYVLGAMPRPPGASD